MGLIKTAFFHDEAYHRINSFEYHRDRKRLRIRLEVYPSKAKEKILATTEFQIIEKSFIDNCRVAGEKAVNMGFIRKQVEKKIKKVESTLSVDEELTQPAKELIFQEEKDFAITEKMKDIGSENFRNFIEDF